VLKPARKREQDAMNTNFSPGDLDTARERLRDVIKGLAVVR